MNTKREAFYPSGDSLKIIEACALSLTPEDKALAEWHRSYVDNHKLRIASDLDIVRDTVPANHSILELGSVPLLLTLALSRCNYAVTGCDIAPERYASTLSSTGMNVVKCDIEQEPLPFPDNAFDAIVFNELFEHLRINLVCTLSEALRVLKPNGTLMLSSPNLKSLGGLINYLIRDKAFSCSGNIYAEYMKLQSLGHMGHVREYTKTEVIEFLGNVGFSVNGLIYRGRYGSNLKQLIIRAIPSLSPFISYIATKPLAAAPEMPQS